MSFVLAACEMPDIAGLNSMPNKTGEMADKMDTTNEAIHKQTLLLALVELNKRENQENIFPVPTGLMPAGKVFAEEARPNELIELTYNELKKLEENTMISGIDKDGPVALTPQEENYARMRKVAALSSLQIIAGFAQDEKIEAIINTDIKGNSRFKDTALAFLALRAYFLRDVLLKLSLKVDASSAETLNTSGKMNEAIKYLVKLDKISKSSDTQDIPTIQLKLKGQAAFIGFEENETARRSETPALWALALQKAQEGSKSYQTNASTSSNAAAEMKAQESAMETMKSYVNSWNP
jgi:hypothetical protein